MWDEECDIYDALDEHNLETEFVDDFADVELEYDLIEDAPGEALDDDSLYDDED